MKYPLYKDNRAINWYLLILAIIGIGCNGPTPIQHKIIYNTLDHDTTINISYFVGDYWDRIYIFSNYSSEEDIALVTKCEYHGGWVPDGIHRLVIVHNNMIVHTEDWENSNDGIIEFRDQSPGPQKFYMKFSSDHPFFQLKRVYDSLYKVTPHAINRPVYILTNLKN